jgi:hypothetical protein
MLIDFEYLRLIHDLHIKGVVHVGAHYGEEVDDYLAAGIDKVVCFEPVLENFLILSNKASDKVQIIQCALGEREDDNVKMFLSSNNKESSSVLEPLEHLNDYQHITFEQNEYVKMKRLDSFAKDIDGCNYISLDVQGYEYEVLLGAEESLKNFDYVYLEVNRGETYKNNHLVEDIDALLKNYGFNRVRTEWVARTWGDAFYIKDNK